jgi:DNA polymerase elongation subunit (family B)
MPEPSKARILTLDIETSPNLSYVFDVWRDKVGVGKLVDHSSVLCFAAKWLGNPNVNFYSDWEDDHDLMVEMAWQFLDRADIVVTYNGANFDVKRLNAEFWQLGLGPPRPYRHIDLYKTVRRVAQFPSSSLNYVSGRIDIGQKVKHEGFGLWRGVMLGDPAAQARMERYNKGDVRLTEKLYKRTLPWIEHHPPVLVVPGKVLCPRCGSDKFDTVGTIPAVAYEYAQLQCRKDGGYFKGHRLGRIS